MKKIFLVLFLFLINGVAFATPSNQESWNGLVDYVNCRYVKAYIDDYAKSHQGEDVRLYKENVKRRLEEVGNLGVENNVFTLTGKPLQYEELSQLLIANKWSGVNEKLASVIEKRKKDVANFDKLISISEFSEELQKSLKSCHAELTEVFPTSTNGMQTTLKKVEKLQSEVDNLNSQLNEQKSQTMKNKSNATFWMWLSIVFIILFVLAAACFAYFHFFKDKKEIERLRNNNEELHEDNRKLQLKSQRLQELESVNKVLEIQLKKATEPSSQETVKPKENVIEVKEAPKPVVEPQPKEEVRYFQYPNANLEVSQLYPAESPNFYYKAIMLSDDKAKFEFCGKSEKAINNSDSYLANACEFQTIPNNVSQVITDEPGIISMQSGIWKVEKKAKVRFR